MLKGNKSEKELANEKSKRIMEGVAYWCAFYRHNPQRFVVDYLNITNLKLFQKILLYAMMANDHIMFLASRGLGKTFLTALFCVVRCILFPRTKICIASSTRSQANEVLLKIQDDFMQGYGWGSENLRREIKDCNIGANKAEISFKNGSWIRVVTASDTGRGNRANILIVDEFRMVDLNTITSVLQKFLIAERQPLFLNNPIYKDYREPNKEIYMSSAWYQIHWGFDKAKSYTANLLNDKVKYFICGLPYQIAVKEGLYSIQAAIDEMSESTFNEMTWKMEMECIWWGESKDAFFSFDDISKRRVLKKAIYPPILVPRTKIIVPDLVANERRILSVDIALMASKKHNNDASSAILNSAIPNSNNKYMGNITYLQNFEGFTTDKLALNIRRLYSELKCTDLVLDTNGNGLGVYDLLTQDIYDSEKGVLYPALSCRNDKAMADRCTVPNAPKVIWSVKASANFNTECCTLLRNGFKSNKINLLLSEQECGDYLKEYIKNYKSLTINEQMDLQMPYLQTTLLIYELINLLHEIKGTNVRIYEKSGMRKDRYSSLAYNFWVQNQIERELQGKNNDTGMAEYAEKMRKLNRKPKFY